MIHGAFGDGTSVTTITAESDGLQSSMVNVALSEGINKLELSGDAVSIRDITTCRDAADDSNAITLEAESLQLAGGAQTRENSASNASGYSYVTGLGKQFVTEESGAFGMGDQTRVVTLDTNNTPKIADAVRGTVTIPAGTILRESLIWLYASRTMHSLVSMITIRRLSIWDCRCVMELPMVRK